VNWRKKSENSAKSDEINLLKLSSEEAKNFLSNEVEEAFEYLSGVKEKGFPRFFDKIFDSMYKGLQNIRDGKKSGLIQRGILEHAGKNINNLYKKLSEGIEKNGDDKKFERAIKNLRTIKTAIEKYKQNHQGNLRNL